MTEAVLVKKKHAGGRPRKDYKALLPANWREIVIEMAKEGASEAEIRAKILDSSGTGWENIRRMFNALKDNEVEFATVIKTAKIYSEAWWVNAGKERLTSRYFQAAIWIFNMKNRFSDHWRDKTDLEIGLSENLLEKFQGIKSEELEKRAFELINATPAKAA